MNRVPKPNRHPDTDHLVQCGALCWREKGSHVEILLITSRDTGRWIIPKGWPMDGKTLAEAAAQEAWEEAGIKGAIHPFPIGSYHYIKPDRANALVEVTVYSTRASQVKDKYPERKQRRRLWCSPDKAASMVDEPGLAELLSGFI